MEKKRIFLASPHMSQENYEMEYIKKAFENNWIAPMGENVTEFEREIEEFTKTKKAVALSTGTAAIHMALKLAGVGPGDLVFCQSLTFAATANPILYEGAKPVFIDSQKCNWNMSPSALELALQKYEKIGKLPKAVIVVHLYGMSAKIDEIVSICKRYKVTVIEDAAESLGTIYKGRHTGTFGDYGVVSFNGNKIITASSGGMILVNTETAKESAEKVLFWSTQAREKAKWYQHKEIGYNYRMSNIVAGIGRGQLKVLGQRIKKKRFIYEFYKKKLTEEIGIHIMPGEMAEESCNNCWLTVVQVEEIQNIRPLDMIAALEAENVESRPVWKPLHLQPVFAGYDFISEIERIEIIDKKTGADSSIAGSIFKNGLCLPSDTKMTEEDLNRVCMIIKGLCK